MVHMRAMIYSFENMRMAQEQDSTIEIWKWEKLELEEV